MSNECENDDEMSFVAPVERQKIIEILKGFDKFQVNINYNIEEMPCLYFFTNSKKLQHLNLPRTG